MLPQRPPRAAALVHLQEWPPAIGRKHIFRLGIDIMLAQEDHRQKSSGDVFFQRSILLEFLDIRSGTCKWDTPIV